MKKNTLHCLSIAAFLTLQLFSAAVNAQTSPAQKEPVIEGSPYKAFPYEVPSKFDSEEEKTKFEKEAKKGPSPKTVSTAPKTRTRGNDPLDGGGRTIYQYTNYDFPQSTWNTCGQAAVATAVWNAGLKNSWSGTPETFAQRIYRNAPPKITVPGLPEVKGLGTDWRQVNVALDGFRKNGVQYNWFKGRSELNKYIDMGLPCIIMLDMGVFGMNMWGSGHWVVAFARDANGYYVSNWDRGWNKERRDNYISWRDLNRAWGGSFNEGNLARVHGTAEMFCVVWK